MHDDDTAYVIRREQNDTATRAYIGEDGRWVSDRREAMQFSTFEGAGRYVNQAGVLFPVCVVEF